MRFAIAVCLSVWVSCASLKANEPDPEQTVQAADQALRRMLADADNPLPPTVLAEAHCVIILPESTQASLLVGSRRAHGVALLRNEDGRWNAPRFVTFSSGSIGIQAGRLSGDSVSVIISRERADVFRERGSLQLAVHANVLSGSSMEKKRMAKRNARPKVDVKVYSDVEGLSAGARVELARIHFDESTETAYYQTAQNGRLPESADILLANLTAASRPAPVQPAAYPSTVPPRAARVPQKNLLR